MRKWTKLTPKQIGRLLGDRRGGVAIMTAMSLTSLMGAAGLGTEATMWYVAKRNMQGATDAAAFTAVTAEGAGQNSTAAKSAGKAVAAQYGFTNSAAGVTVTVNIPPTTGNYTSNAQAAEVLVSQPQTMLFTQLFLASAPTIQARAVAIPGVAGGDCVMALKTGNVVGMQNSGTASLTLNSCDLVVNASNTGALTTSGTATITAAATDIVGGYSHSGTSSVVGTLSTGATAAPDPYAGVNIPSYSSTCNQTSLTVLSAKTLTPSSPTTPYVLCNNVSLSGTSANLTLNPGIYVINNGSLNVSGGATITGTDVTIILTSSTGKAYGTVTVSGTSTVNLTAPTTGPTAGLAIYQDRNAPSTGTDTFSGTAKVSITGAMYFPSQAVSWSGNSAVTAPQCTQLIASTLTFSGTTTMNSNCAGVGVLGMNSSSAKLVE